MYRELFMAYDMHRSLGRVYLWCHVPFSPGHSDDDCALEESFDLGRRTVRDLSIYLFVKNINSCFSDQMCPQSLG